MKIKVYNSLPKEAMDIRIKVFVDEQGFVDEIDDIDSIATHIVMYDTDLPIATCRIFESDDRNVYTLGRLAVIKEYRGKGIGAKMIEEAEKTVREKGGTSVVLHSQCRAKEFYKNCGYAEYGEIEYEENCLHIWMRKNI